jgi:hypothetical protein
MEPAQERTFRVEGGRAGVIRFSDGTRSAELDWEMLGWEADMVIYGEACRWTSPEPRKMTKAEVHALAHEFARVWQVRIDLMFLDGFETVIPSRTGGA